MLLYTLYFCIKRASCMHLLFLFLLKICVLCYYYYCMHNTPFCRVHYICVCMRIVRTWCDMSENHLMRWWSTSLNSSTRKSQVHQRQQKRKCIWRWGHARSKWCSHTVFYMVMMLSNLVAWGEMIFIIIKLSWWL